MKYSVAVLKGAGGLVKKPREMIELIGYMVGWCMGFVTPPYVCIPTTAVRVRINKGSETQAVCIANSTALVVITLTGEETLLKVVHLMAHELTHALASPVEETRAEFMQLPYEQRPHENYAEDMASWIVQIIEEVANEQESSV